MNKSSLRRRITASLQDIRNGALRWRIWTSFAEEDIRQTYRRSIIGVAWIALSFSIFLLVKTFVFGAMIGQLGEKYFGAYLMIGFFSWQFMSQIVTTAPTTFLRAEAWIKNESLPFTVYVYQSVYRSLFDLLLTGGVVILGLIYFGYGWSPYSLLVIPAIMLYIINALWVTMLLAILGCRVRDVQHLTQTAVRIMFFMTPIFWMPSQLGEQAMAILWWNPFAHFIWILRGPIIDQSLVLDSWIYVSTFTAIGCSITLIGFVRFRRHIPFWF